jgi:hypothetical protein
MKLADEADIDLMIISRFEQAGDSARKQLRIFSPLWSDRQRIPEGEPPRLRTRLLK